MKEFTVEKNHMNVNSVVCVVVHQEPLSLMKGFTLERSLMNVNNVASILA